MNKIVKNQVFNPYLPLSTYIPDGEPHVFGDRLYVFGSHDKEGGEKYCMLDYEVWSTPVNDLTAWRCEGTVYRAKQDPDYGEDYMHMYAPDVVQGIDGRYYLYYAMAGGKYFTGPIHVAVCDSPAGKYEYYGEVRNPDGTTFNRYVTFDPGLINDNGKIWLYYGWALGVDTSEGSAQAEAFNKITAEQITQVEMRLFQKTLEEVKAGPHSYMGANAVQLDKDMLTVVSEPARIVPGQLEANGTEYEGHAFFEASSMRKIGETYYFIYSSQTNHELCYATSKYPDRDFKYGGVIISNGDIGYKNRTPQDRLAISGNNHGSIVELNGQWYIFYHRQTHKTTYSRQGCAEKISILNDGSIPQVEMTSCGLNDGPLVAKGWYPAAICCNLTNGNIPHQGTGMITDVLPHITHEDNKQFITEITDETLIGYKYFKFEGSSKLTLKIRGNATGKLLISADEKLLGEIPITPSSSWREISTNICTTGKHALNFIYKGEGTLDFESFVFEI